MNSALLTFVTMLNLWTDEIFMTVRLVVCIQPMCLVECVPRFLGNYKSAFSYVQLLAHQIGFRYDVFSPLGSTSWNVWWLVLCEKVVDIWFRIWSKWQEVKMYIINVTCPKLWSKPLIGRLLYICIYSSMSNCYLVHEKQSMVVLKQINQWILWHIFERNHNCITAFAIKACAELQ